MDKPPAPKVYRHFTAAELDAEYNNRAKVADWQAHLQYYIDSSHALRQSMPSELGLAYGESAAESLDLFFCNGRPAPTSRQPLHVFFHGGYWSAMHKDDFSYVANAFAGYDVICAVVNYALIPPLDMDALVAQCRRALLWLWQHIAAYGGAAETLTLSGHSAGGHLVAMMMATDWSQHGVPNLVKAGVSLSGLFDLEPLSRCYLNQTLNLGSAVRRNSPLHLTKHSRGPLLCYFGDLEGEEYRRQSECLAHNWPDCEAIGLAAHDHFTIVRELNQPQSFIARQLRQQLGV